MQQAHASGLSLGSCIAQELALTRPDLVKTLQLHGTWGRAHGYAARKFKAQIELLRILNLSRFYEINVLWFYMTEFMSRHSDRLASQLGSILGAAPSREDLIELYTSNLHHDTLDRLRQIKVPTLVTVGSFVVALPPMYDREVAVAIPGAEFVLFEGGGHFHNQENPDEFNTVTLDFLVRHS